MKTVHCLCRFICSGCKFSLELLILVYCKSSVTLACKRISACGIKWHNTCRKPIEFSDVYTIKLLVIYFPPLVYIGKSVLVSKHLVGKRHCEPPLWRSKMQKCFDGSKQRKMCTALFCPLVYLKIRICRRQPLKNRIHFESGIICCLKSSYYYQNWWSELM